MPHDIDIKTCLSHRRLPMSVPACSPGWVWGGCVGVGWGKGNKWWVGKVVIIIIAINIITCYYWLLHIIIIINC